MKKLFALTMLICLAMICSCQKQGSAAERQLAQRKAELDAREKALDEREKALNEKELNGREKALAERENPTASAPTISPALQSRDKVRDLEQLKAERDRRMQQLPPEVRALIPDPAQVIPGCRYSPRCAIVLPQCRVEAPALLPAGAERCTCW